MDFRKHLGFAGESLVARYLEEQGFQVIQKNYTTRYGEIDLIAQKDEYLVFVEVKTRKSNYFQLASVVTPSKQKKIVKSAKLFIMTNQVYDKVCRFDVATVLEHQGNHEIEYIPNAFWG